MITQNSTQEEIQQAIDAGGTVEFAPGVYENAHYRITVPVHLKGSGALLAGGQKIRWQEQEDGVLFCEVDKPQPIRTLVVNGSLRQRCRIPESGYLKHESVFDVKWMSTTGGGWQRKPTLEELTTLKTQKDALKGLTLEGAELTVLHSWDDSMVTVAGAQRDVITFAGPAGHPAGGFGVQDYCLWNVPESFTKEGTFWHDVKGGRVYYRPLPGENADTEAWLPVFESIFYAEKPVENLEIEGFALTATDTPRESAGFGAYKMPGAIDLSDVRNSRLHHLCIFAVGGYGIRTTGKVSALQVNRCEISDTGAGGLRVGSGGEDAKSEISDCRVQYTGLYYPAAIGIAAANCNILHNEVSHTSYSAINCSGNDYTVEKNLLHDAMEVLNDGAAIYSFGTQRGVLRENLTWGIHPKDGHILRIAYYLDETARDWLVERNVALDCDYPNHNHMCGGHTYRENLFVSGADLLITMQNAASANRYLGNVLSAAGEIIIRMPVNGMEEFSGNAFHSSSGRIRHGVVKGYDVLEERDLSMGENNRRIDQLDFSIHERLFEAAGLKIDLTDVGVRRES